MSKRQQTSARKEVPQRTEPFELSVRVRHPEIDPAEISKALELEPDHCFRAGEPRSAGGRSGTHPQTYWLAPVDVHRVSLGDPSFLDELADVVLAKQGISADRMAEVSRSFREAGVKHGSFQLEGLLFALLARLNMRQEFLTRIQREGGDLSILIVADPSELRSFSLSVSITRFLAKLNITVEFEFDSDG